MEQDAGLVFGRLLDGFGGAHVVGWDQLEVAPNPQEVLWVHLDYTETAAKRWLEESSGLDPVVREALVMEETRPRSVAQGSGLLLILRGVNLNPGADPQDMVSLRLWIEPHRVISLRHRKLKAIEDLRTELERGDGPRSAGEFLVALVDHLVGRMGSILGDLDDAVDAVEERVVEEESRALRTEIGRLRRQTIALRRYLAPQRDVLARLQGEKVPWLSDLDRVHLRELADRTTRYVEDLDAARDRAAVTQEELNNRLAEQMNRTMYVLSIIAGIFLPLGLLTGLLGINVGGIPGTENPLAFVIVCGILAAVAVLETWLFRRMRWL